LQGCQVLKNLKRPNANPGPLLPEENVKLDPGEVDTGDDDEQGEYELNGLRPTVEQSKKNVRPVVSNS
jgi:hypothetical protein